VTCKNHLCGARFSTLVRALGQGLGKEEKRERESNKPLVRQDLLHIAEQFSKKEKKKKKELNNSFRKGRRLPKEFPFPLVTALPFRFVDHLLGFSSKKFETAEVDFESLWVKILNYTKNFGMGFAWIIWGVQCKNKQCMLSAYEPGVECEL